MRCGRFYQSTILAELYSTPFITITKIDIALEYESGIFCIIPIWRSLLIGECFARDPYVPGNKMAGKGKVRQIVTSFDKDAVGIWRKKDTPWMRRRLFALNKWDWFYLLKSFEFHVKMGKSKDKS